MATLHNTALLSTNCRVDIYDVVLVLSNFPKEGHYDSAPTIVLDPAGIFHNMCHLCDSQKLNINPDLSIVLDTIDSPLEPDMSWVKGFYDGRPRMPASTGTWPQIELPRPYGTRLLSPTLVPSMKEISEVGLATLALETPVKKCQREARGSSLPSVAETSRYALPSQLQRMPQAQREDEVLENSAGAVADAPSSDDEQSYIVSAQVHKKYKLWSWANHSDEDVPDQPFEDWIEEEENRQPRKKLQQSF
ncbi:MAG: hypothetical protein Q9213_001995 [Squamulea squamosa]